MRIAQDVTDSTIRSSLLRLREQFYSAIDDGDSALTIFEQSWATFNVLVSTHAEILQDETRSEVLSFAENVNTVTLALLGLNNATESIHAEFQDDVAKIFSEQLTLQEYEEPPMDNPSYVHHTSHWLLANIHNPYPSRLIRDSISRQTNCCRHTIDGWFAEARKRIGWNAIRKQLFPKKVDMLEAAMCYFHEKAVSHEGKLSTNAKSVVSLAAVQFATMEQRARNLYSSHSCGSRGIGGDSKKESPTSRNRRSVDQPKTVTTCRTSRKRKLSDISQFDSDSEARCHKQRRKEHRLSVNPLCSSVDKASDLQNNQSSPADAAARATRKSERSTSVAVDPTPKHLAGMEFNQQAPLSFPAMTSNQQSFEEWLRFSDEAVSFTGELPPPVMAMSTLLAASTPFEIDTYQFDLSPRTPESSLAPETPPSFDFIEGLPSFPDLEIINSEMLHSVDQNDDCTNLPFNSCAWNFGTSFSTLDPLTFPPGNSLWLFSEPEAHTVAPVPFNSLLPQASLDWSYLSCNDSSTSKHELSKNIKSKYPYGLLAEVQNLKPDPTTIHKLFH